MRIVHVFNMANAAYNIAKFQRRIGMDVDLIIRKNDFGMALPQWEEGYFTNIDPYHVDWSKINNLPLPDWIKVWNPGPIVFDPKSIFKLIIMVKEYDLMQLYTGAVIYLQFIKIPYIVYEAGWMRRFAIRDKISDKLARRGYKYAKCIIMTNPDMYRILKKMKKHMPKDYFIPFAIDHEIYRPMNLSRLFDEFTFFHPTRQSWEEKGNDKFIKAFAEFTKKYDAKLILVRWGKKEDIKRTEELIKKLEISNKVLWIRPVSKKKLVEYYNRVDVVLDQCVLGSYGALCPEAMSCEKPVIIYLDPFWTKKCYGAFPPVLNACTVEEIYQQMVKCLDDTFRKNIGKKSRKWVIEKHDGIKIAKMHKFVYESIMHK